MIETPRLRLVPCDDTLFDAIKMGNNVLGRVMGLNVPKKWTEFRDTFAPSYERWKQHPPLREWWVYLTIHKERNQLIGSCGYKGEPDSSGIVEIGYEIMPDMRAQGLATETAKGLVEHAFASNGVHKVIAHTMSEENASTQLLQNLGFVYTSDVQDSDEGALWLWELARKTWKEGQNK
ncbi:RimJ/RimL family protein N-acetyltransferase [Dyadobacter jejuensis]|uniref:RimJ/RimL family protein N-acetyltransferase n=1 Tax=Dyadobacter jejuensis TaxID=1082580 RepID=A0A316AIE5_9BACT|nr:GNAT family N-acetyltransferase [Dyadobacter jejuensis]PWJ57545.1 RimJ/RimL family protein N-acetyltransferase [Dyadobacter jejuensis]